MKTTMTSRERLSAAIALEEPDHVPLWCLWSYDQNSYNRSDEKARIRATQALGMDDTLWLHAPWRLAPEVEVSAWVEQVPGANYALMHKHYETPAGAADHTLRSSEYLSRPEDFGIVGDLNMSHGVKFLVEGWQDLAALRYLLCDPDNEHLARFSKQAKAYRQFAEEEQILLEGAYVGDTATWLMGRKT